jgi:hypothetical protein
MGSSIGCGSVLEFQALSRICDFSDFRHGVSSGLLSVEIVWTKLNVVGSGGKVGGVETGREGRGEGGNEEKRPIGEREVTPLDALESALSLPVMPV